MDVYLQEYHIPKNNTENFFFSHEDKTDKTCVNNNH